MIINFKTAALAASMSLLAGAAFATTGELDYNASRPFDNPVCTFSNAVAGVLAEDISGKLRARTSDSVGSNATIDINTVNVQQISATPRNTLVKVSGPAGAPASIAIPGGEMYVPVLTGAGLNGTTGWAATVPFFNLGIIDTPDYDNTNFTLGVPLMVGLDFTDLPKGSTYSLTIDLACTLSPVS